jgi:DNA-binding response OmpR family regulator
MFRFLIVEDVRLTLTHLTDLLQATFPGSQVDAAETVSHGLALIQDASEPYHAAILDFNLPKDVGTSPTIDTTLCVTVRTRMREVLVVHITGYMEDRIVADHIIKAHNDPEDIRFMVSKSDPEWGSTLVNELEGNYILA